MAVDQLSFSVRPGQVTGFLGPNGAGKSTTINILCTLMRATSGAATVAGVDVDHDPAGVRRRIGLVFQDPSLDQQLTARENLEFHAFVYDVPASSRKERIAEVLEMVELTDRADSVVMTYSGGMRRRLEIARGMLHTPDVLFLDEPTIGLDLISQQRIRDFIRRHNRDRKTTIILTSHYMRDIQELCERVIIMTSGEILFDGPLDELVRRHSSGKILKLTFSVPVDQAGLERYGKILAADPFQVTLQVPREECTRLAAQVLAELPVADIAIDEPEADDIIRGLFEQEVVAQAGSL